jgi:hypothetical protein
MSKQAYHKVYLVYLALKTTQKILESFFDDSGDLLYLVVYLLSASEDY